MSYDISVDEKNRIINIAWHGAIDFSTLKRHLLSYNHHMTHTDHHMLYDFRNVSDIVLNEEAVSQIADLSRQIFDPLIKDIKVAIVGTTPEIESLAKIFVLIRESRSVTSPLHGFFNNADQATGWLLNDS